MAGVELLREARQSESEHPLSSLLAIRLPVSVVLPGVPGGPNMSLGEFIRQSGGGGHAQTKQRLWGRGRYIVY